MASVQILDGGLGTSLQDKYGVNFSSTDTPLWASHLLVSNPETLKACQSDFGEAGVDILLTATYQIYTGGFQNTKTAEFPQGIPASEVGRFLRTAVEVAEISKVRDSAKIALSLGPYGACMIPGQEYGGLYDAEHDDEENLYRWHLERLQLFQNVEGEDLTSRIQYVAFETLPRLDEDECLPDGSNVEQVVEASIGPMEGALVPLGIGMNCTKVHKLSGLVDRFGACVKDAIATGLTSAVPSLILYPDGTNGEVYNTMTQTWERPEGQGSNQDVRPWEVQLAQVVSDANAKGPFQHFIVGGCCKASHKDITKLREQFTAA
ncbi:hypothetical protein N7481_005288 [Penicillium waksmanii]|uniref:uncharacterized protein n=1 Tax=Penicillium waksmanii TaxID=69791 RepID=UPI0025480E48|nr:uncharacterized protein N7481_005288 [Penicillium waksmanii]KAJ5983189.1 hypothetical protein N7481_005288 [Penicillium waksmanii]